MEDNEEFPERETPTGTSSSECSSSCSESDISEETNIKQVYNGHSGMTIRTQAFGNGVVRTGDKVSSINSYSDVFRFRERRNSWHGETSRENKVGLRLFHSLRKEAAVSNIAQNIADPLRQFFLFNNSNTNQQCAERQHSRPNSAIKRSRRHAPSEYRHTGQTTHLVEESLPNFNIRPYISIFVTYSTGFGEDSNMFFREITELVHNARGRRLHVDFDMDRASFAARRLNIDDWIDKCYKMADWIIVCISPAYPEDVEEPTGACAGTSQLNARYIYDKIRLEYKNNQCQNKRVIPIMFTHLGATNAHVPQCMQTTFVYQYPNDIHAILDVLSGGGNYRPD